MTAIARTPSLSSIPFSRRAARVNARVARRLGWKSSDILVREIDGRWTVSVAGRKFNIFFDKKLCRALGNTFHASVKERDTKASGHLFSAKVPGSVASEFCETAEEALARAIIATPRPLLRTFF